MKNKTKKKKAKISTSKKNEAFQRKHLWDKHRREAGGDIPLAHTRAPAADSAPFEPATLALSQQGAALGADVTGRGRAELSAAGPPALPPLPTLMCTAPRKMRVSAAGRSLPSWSPPAPCHVRTSRGDSARRGRAPEWRLGVTERGKSRKGQRDGTGSPRHCRCSAAGPAPPGLPASISRSGAGGDRPGSRGWLSAQASGRAEGPAGAAGGRRLRLPERSPPRSRGLVSVRGQRCELRRNA